MLLSAVLFSVASSVSMPNTIHVDPSQGASFALGRPGELNAQAVAWPQYGRQPQPQAPTHIYNANGSITTIAPNAMGGAAIYHPDGSVSQYVAEPGGHGGTLYNNDGSLTIIR